MMKHPRIEDDVHLEFIRTLPCLCCGDNTSTEAAHIRYGDPRSAKPSCTGLGRKPDDSFTVPLCGKHHRKQHTGNERKFWHSQNIDPIFVSLALFRVSGDYEAGCQIVSSNRAFSNE